MVATLQEESAKRQSFQTDLRKMLDKALEDETTMRKKFLEMSTEKQTMVVYLSRANVENASLKQQVCFKSVDLYKFSLILWPIR